MNPVESKQKTLSNILKSFAPMYHTCRIAGLLPTNEKPKGNLLYFLIYFIAYTSTSSYCLFRVIYDENNETATSKIFSQVEWSLIALLQTSTLICNYVFRKKFRTILNELTQVDENLKRYDVSTKYRMTLKSTIQLTIMAYLIVAVNAVVFLMSAGRSSENYAVQRVVLFASTVFRCLLKYEFVVYLTLLRDRFSAINSALKSLCETRNKCPLLFSIEEAKRAQRKEELLYVMCRTHYKMSNICRLVNATFSFQMLCSLGISMYNVLYQSYYLYVIVSGKTERFDVLETTAVAVRLAVELFEVYVLVAVCDSTSERVSRLLMDSFCSEN